MDVKLLKIFFISVLKVLVIFVKSTITLDALLVTDNGSVECTRELKGIVLTPLDSRLFGQPGPVGDKGITGSCGDQGEKGEVGSSGRKGEMGLQGPTGQMGPKGEKGEKGLQGIKGEKGSFGEKGEPGLQGQAGEKGKRGDKDIGPKGLPGAPGSVGVPGTNGHRGTCPCNGNHLKVDNDFGTNNKPAVVNCKSFPQNKTSGIYYLQDTSKHSMKVHCNMKTLETCIISNKNSSEYFYTGHKSDGNKVRNFTKDGPFWMSDKIEIKDLYGVTEAQITWLQKISSSVRQTIRYHCNNSIPYSKSDITSSIHLLTWNDIVIGPYPSDETPFFYSVPRETDNCDNGSNSEQYSDIVLQSTNAYRLPIIDIQIRDIRDELQMFYIQSVELCFS